MVEKLTKVSQLLISFRFFLSEAEFIKRKSSVAEIKTNKVNVSQTELHPDCFLNGGKILKKDHIEHFQIFIFWTLERSNYLNNRLKMFRIMSTFIFYHTQDSKISQLL